MKINKQLTSSTNSKQMINLNKSIKCISVSNNGTIFAQDKTKLLQNQQTCITSTVSGINKTQTNNMYSSQNDGCGSFVVIGQKPVSCNQSSNLNNFNCIAKETSTSKLLKDIKEKQSKIIVTSGKKETSTEKLIKLNMTSTGIITSQKLSNSNVPESNNQTESAFEIDPKIPSLKSTSKQKTKIAGTSKDAKINLMSSTKIKMQNPILTSSNFSYASTEKQINDGPVVIHHNIVNNPKTSIRQLPNGNISPPDLDSAHETEVCFANAVSKVNDSNDTKIPISNLAESENQKSTKRKANINITNNYNSNIHVNTFSPPSHSIYDELSKKLVKQNISTNSTNHKAFFSEESEITNCALNTEEKSSRKRPNHNILESENPEDLHFIQVEMLLQSKLISKRFESGEMERSPKILPSKLPMLSVIPTDEIDL